MPRSLLAAMLLFCAINQVVRTDAADISKSTARFLHSLETGESYAYLDELSANEVDDCLKELEVLDRQHMNVDSEAAHTYRELLRVGHEPDARRTLEAADLRKSDDPEPFVILGFLELQQQHIMAAKLLLRKGNELIEKLSGQSERKRALSTIAIRGLAAVSELSGDYNAAKTHLEKLLEHEPKNAAIMQRIARTMFCQGDEKGALRKLREAKALDSNLVAGESVVACLYAACDDGIEADIWFDKASKADPNTFLTHEVTARYAVSCGSVSKAAEQADACLKLAPRSIDAMLLRGMVAMYQEDFQAAEKQFGAANAQLPENMTVARYLALALCEQGDAAKLERAFKLADTAHDENPGDPSTAAALGWVLFKQKNYDAAAKVLRQSKQLNGGKFTPNAAYYYAEVLSAQGQKPEAKKILEELLRRDNSFSKRGRARRLNESL